MIEYAKTILPKVVSNKVLFRKELLKSINWAEGQEKIMVYRWSYVNFSAIYPDILTEAGSIINSTKKRRYWVNKNTEQGFYKQQQQT